MTCDEGYPLDASDSAPSPLCYFTAGAHFSLLHAHRKALESSLLDKLYESKLRTRFALKGSVLRGDMDAKALPPDFWVSNLTSSGNTADITKSLSESGVGRFYNSAMANNTFALTWNDNSQKLSPNHTPEEKIRSDIKQWLDTLEVKDGKEFVTRLHQVTKNGHAEGVGLALLPEQDRSLEFVSECTASPNSATICKVGSIVPTGSTYGFESDVVHNADTTFPSSQMYMNMAILFCYMTQIERYAKIKKIETKDLQLYQEQVHDELGGSLHTHISVNSRSGEKAMTDTVKMAEKMCFLHVALRDAHPINFTDKF
eukprot:CAMPEP_0168512656 /NCGR_PEP_ID=MMETSP0405-20121227/2937_1 /TAXON_ID=498012 /ORGANISM="Trichosphaerium sp, Strain Am-I-7 wt" /LENGTH=313 /DNA_ID=CAMNT_0008531219 /DNA_START=442 /DNA_END=1383 /DNA_ORIENTATION=-